jgi:uncharacterized RDD family membrane protein YckC
VSATPPPEDPWTWSGSGDQPPPPPGGYPPPPPSWQQPPPGGGAGGYPPPGGGYGGPGGGYGGPGGGYPPPPPSWQQPQGYYGGGSPGPGGQLAGWWQRVGASLVDGILLLVAFFVLARLIGGIGILLSIILDAVYITMMLARDGQTLGNKAVRTRVVDSRTGGPLTTGKALGRWASQAVLGFISLIGLLDVLWPLWDRQNQTLHDKMASTVVLRDQ